MHTKQLFNNGTSISSELANLITTSYIKVDGSSRRLLIDIENYYVDASFDQNTLDFSCEIMVDGDYIHLSEEEEDNIITCLDSQYEPIETAFTQDDYDHAISLIYK